MNIFEITLKSTPTTLVESVCKDLTAPQRRVVEGVVRELRPLFEDALTPDQISKIFTQAEQEVTAAGSNRSGVGKTVDATKAGIGKTVDATKAAGSAVGAAAGAVNKAIDGLGGLLQKTAPVKYFDKKFETLKTNIAAKLGADSNTMAAIDKLGQYARANPGKTAFAIGTLTAIAAFATGPAGGAVAGQVLRAATELLKGEQLSSALGKGAKSAAIGGLVGAGAKELGGMLSSTMQAVADQLHPGVNRLMLDWKNVFGQTVANIDVRGLPQDIAPIQAMWRKAVAQYSSGNYSKAVERLMQLDQMVDKISTPEYISKLSTEIQDRKNWQAGAKAFKKAIDATVAAAQGVATATTANTPAPTAAPAAAAPAAPPAPAAPAANFNQVRENHFRLTSYEIREIFTIAGGLLSEGPMDWVRTYSKGKNITNKITADKLNLLWKKEGSPADSDHIAVILQRAGIDDKVIAAAFKAVSAPLPSFISKSAIEPTAQPATATEPATATATEPATATATEPAAGKSATAAPAMDTDQILKSYEMMAPEQRKQLIKDLEIIDNRDRPFIYPNESRKRQRRI
jgi:hypothetical protein